MDDQFNSVEEYKTDMGEFSTKDIPNNTFEVPRDNMASGDMVLLDKPHHVVGYSRVDEEKKITYGTMDSNGKAVYPRTTGDSWLYKPQYEWSHDKNIVLRWNVFNN